VTATTQQPVDRTDTRVTVTVASDILFASGKAELKNSAQQTLAQVASVLESDYAGKTIRVESQYDGLAGQRFAVLVAADEYTLYRYPEAPLQISRAMTARLAENLPGATPTDPQQLDRFQQDNPFWNTLRYTDLVEMLGVDRLVVVDLVDYRTREPGNAHVWRGVITANIGVIEAEAPDPDNFAFSTTVRTEFPPDTKVGVVNSDEETIQLGMLSQFSRDAAGLFYDYEYVQP